VGRTVSAVRPFRSRLVTQDRSAGVVVPMVDSLDDTIPDLRSGVTDPNAYVEAPAALYVYRQRRGTESHTGIVCDVATEAFVDGRVRGHESVRPDRVEALVRHFATTRDRPALVALLHRAGPEGTDVVAATCRTPHLLDFTGPDGHEQTVWRVADGRDTDALTRELGGGAHYIADGHHRVAASLGEWRSAGKPPDAGVLCVVYPLDGLDLSAFHRRVVGPVDRTRLLDLLSQEFDVRESATPPDPTIGRFGVYSNRTWMAATFRGTRPDGASGLDVSVLHAAVIGELGQGVDAVPNVEFAPAGRELDELTERCDRDGGALFTLAPPDLDVLTGLADRGEVMPPKTTYFEPKPCAGIFLRS
jgi:uncharacterized protein (DUF1015 family)